MPPPTSSTAPSTALLTDRYELTMLDAAVVGGTVDRTCVFEAFARRLPEGRRFAVAAGLARVLDALEAFRFDDDVLAALERLEVVSEPTLAWLAGYRFRGDVWALPEGELASPGVPLLSVTASFGEAVVLETVLLSILNHDTAVASAAARMVLAADGRPLLEFGGRRTHEAAAVDAARAAYLVGFAGSSNLTAGARYGVPTLGTSAHAFTLLHDDEPHAFRTQVGALGTGTTLLVDTYDTAEGTHAAVAAAGEQLGAIRIDSGDLVAEAYHARARLDELGATGTRIVVSGDLDEHGIAACRGAPVDAFGVGTSVVTGAGAPTAGLVYKLVARARTPGGPLEPVAKAGGDKATVAGRKAASRRLDEHGRAVADVLHPWGSPPPDGARPLLVEVVRGGRRLPGHDLAAARAHHAHVRDVELPEAGRDLSPGPPAIAIEHRDLPAPGIGDPDPDAPTADAARAGGPTRPPAPSPDPEVRP